MGGVAVRTRVQFRDSMGRYASNVERGGEEAQRELGEIGAALAKALAPKRSGALAGGIHATGHGFATGGTGHDLPQEEGAGPHPIGDPGQILGNREDDFGPVRGPVMHPGNPAVHYMRNAFRLLKPRIMPTIRRHMP
jgi:hypothetical protein